MYNFWKLNPCIGVTSLGWQSTSSFFSTLKRSLSTSQRSKDICIVSISTGNTTAIDGWEGKTILNNIHTWYMVSMVFTNNFRGYPAHFPLAGWLHAALSFIAPCRVSCVWARILLYTFASWFVQINIWMFSETASRMICNLLIHIHLVDAYLHMDMRKNRCALPYTCAIDNHAGLWACHITSTLTTRKWHQVSSCFLQRMNYTSVVFLFVVPKAPSARQYLRKQTV